MLKGKGFLRVFLAFLLLSGIEAVIKDNFLKVLLDEGVSPVVQHMLVDAKAPFHVNRWNRAVLEFAEVGAALAIDGAARAGLDEHPLCAGNETVDVGEGFYGLLTHVVVQQVETLCTLP